jgi:hypothetical protein
MTFNCEGVLAVALQPCCRLPCRGTAARCSDGVRRPSNGAIVDAQAASVWMPGRPNLRLLRHWDFGSRLRYHVGGGLEALE